VRDAKTSAEPVAPRDHLGGPVLRSRAREGNPERQVHLGVDEPRHEHDPIGLRDELAPADAAEAGLLLFDERIELLTERFQLRRLQQFGEHEPAAFVEGANVFRRRRTERSVRVDGAERKWLPVTERLGTVSIDHRPTVTREYGGARTSVGG
jgi:hypothetical protein